MLAGGRARGATDPGPRHGAARGARRHRRGHERQPGLRRRPAHRRARLRLAVLRATPLCGITPDRRDARGLDHARGAHGPSRRPGGDEPGAARPSALASCPGTAARAGAGACARRWPRAGFAPAALACARSRGPTPRGFTLARGGSPPARGSPAGRARARRRPRAAALVARAPRSPSTSCAATCSLSAIGTLTSATATACSPSAIRSSRPGDVRLPLSTARRSRDRPERLQISFKIGTRREPSARVTQDRRAGVAGAARRRPARCCPLAVAVAGAPAAQPSASRRSRTAPWLPQSSRWRPQQPARVRRRARRPDVRVDADAAPAGGARRSRWRLSSPASARRRRAAPAPIAGPLRFLCRQPLRAPRARQRRHRDRGRCPAARSGRCAARACSARRGAARGQRRACACEIERWRGDAPRSRSTCAVPGRARPTGATRCGSAAGAELRSRYDARGCRRATARLARGRVAAPRRRAAVRRALRGAVRAARPR